MKALKKWMEHKNPVMLSLLVFIIVFLAGCAVTILIEEKSMENQKIRAGYLAQIQAGKIQYVVSDQLYYGRTVEVLLQEGGGSISNFEEKMRLIDEDPHFRNIALAPNGIITEIYPLQGNEEAVGHNLFKDPNRYFDAERAKEAREMFVAGPYELKQGGIGVVGRTPVFLKDGSGKEAFWGFVCVTLEFPRSLDQADLMGLEQMGISYELWNTDPQTGEKLVMAQSKAPLKGKEIVQTVDLSPAQWYLSVTRTGGFINVKEVVICLLVSLVISLLIAIVFYCFQNLEIQRKRLKVMSLTDSLTGLSNRRALFERLEQQLLNCEKFKHQLALCYMDVNGFKQINDTLGHEAGDILLMGVAQRLSHLIERQEDLARIGGDEFVFLTEYEDTVQIEELKQSIREVMSEPFDLNNQNVPITISVGISCYPCDGRSADMLLRCADESMYQMKRKSKAPAVDSKR